MRIKYWTLGLLACAGMVSCSNDDNLAADSSQSSDDVVQTSYLAVNIQNVGSTGTRATDGGYEAGTDAENAIDNVRFYFFDENGGAYNLADGKSYSDYTYTADTEESEGSKVNVEEIGEAILVIDQSQATPPSSIVAVANPPASLSSSSPSLDDLKAQLVDNYMENSKFIMSNSVYVEDNSEVCAVPVSGHIASSVTDAEANPVDVYIERVAAKVRVDFEGTTDLGITGTYYKLDDDTYAKVLGWTLVSVPNQSYCVKNIDTSWTESGLGFDWNSSSDHRSFWAEMPSSGLTYDKSFTLSDVTSIALRYTLENTSDNDKTMVLVSAQLVDGNGDPVSRYEYLGSVYANEEAVLNVIIPTFLNKVGYYYVRTGENQYTTLRTEDVKFVSYDVVGGEDTYRAYPQLQDTFEGAYTGSESTVYTQNADGSFVEADRSDVNDALKAYSAQIWNNGYCYYYTTVQHLGSTGSTGEYGIVRNHVYDVSVTGITGYGTPVYDPDVEITEPVTPDEDYSYIAARVNILSWKVVSQDVTLGE